LLLSKIVHFWREMPARQSATQKSQHKTAEQFQWINDDGAVVEICQVQIPIAVVLRDYSHGKPRPTNSTTSNEWKIKPAPSNLIKQCGTTKKYSLLPRLWCRQINLIIPNFSITYK
jgi:hypothetical protein